MFKKNMANNADPHQTAPKEQSDLGLLCLVRYMVITVIN